MSFPYFISPEQAMRERSELARKGIARGRSVVALVFAGGVLFVAENPSRSLQKISELYDRVGFAAAGKFNEFDNLRRGGIQFADTRGYAYDRRDVTGRQLANVYAQTLGTIFTEQAKPYEVELCVAEVAHYGETKPPELYRITYDGSIADEPHFVVMGGTTEPIATALKDSYAENANLADAVHIAVNALKAGSGNGDDDEHWTSRRWRWPSSTSTGRGEHSGGSPVPRWSGCCLNTTAPSRRTTRRRNRRNRLWPVLIGLLLALGCSVCYGTATVLQAAATRSVDAGDSDSGVDAALLLRALRQWRYLVGIGLDGLGFVLQVAALRLVPIYVVAAAIAGSLAVTAIVAAWVLSTRLSRSSGPPSPWCARAWRCSALPPARRAPGTGHPSWAGRCW